MNDFFSFMCEHVDVDPAAISPALIALADAALACNDCTAALVFCERLLDALHQNIFINDDCAGGLRDAAIALKLDVSTEIEYDIPHVGKRRMVVHPISVRQFCFGLLALALLITRGFVCDVNAMDGVVRVDADLHEFCFTADGMAHKMV